MMLSRPAVKCLFAIAITVLSSCSTTEGTLKIAEDGQRTLCTPAGCVDLFGDYELAKTKRLHPAFDGGSFEMLVKNSKAPVAFTTFMEPHFSGFAMETKCPDCSSEVFGQFLEANGAKNFEMHQLKGKPDNVWVANYQCHSEFYGALAYFRELIYIEGGQTFRYIFWTFDHPQTLKSETIRIFDTFYETKNDSE